MIQPILVPSVGNPFSPLVMILAKTTGFRTLGMRIDSALSNLIQAFSRLLSQQIKNRDRKEWGLGRMLIPKVVKSLDVFVA